MPISCPSDWLDSDAITLALSRLPLSLEKEYKKKLERLEFGTILELALLGRLLQKSGPFDVSPWPKRSRVDAHLTREDRTLELEVKASIETLYEKNVVKMCQLVAEQVAKRWPELKGGINLFNDFREIEKGNVRTLDLQGTLADVMAELERAITPEGEVRPEYREYAPFRLVTKIIPRAELRVWHSSSRLPGGHGQEVIKRTLQRALDDRRQFSGERPAILAVIQVRDPDATLIHRGEPSLAEQFFVKHTQLSAIVAIPGSSVNGPPVVITPEGAQLTSRTHPLLGDEPQALAEFLAVRLQVDPILDGLERELRESLEHEQREKDSRV